MKSLWPWPIEKNIYYQSWQNVLALKPRLHYTWRDATRRDAIWRDIQVLFTLCATSSRAVTWQQGIWDPEQIKLGNLNGCFDPTWHCVYLTDIPQKLHPYALRNHTNTLCEIRILHTGGYWLKFAEVSTQDVKLYKPRDIKPGELTWWRFLEMGSSGGKNRRSRACYATLRYYLGTGANSGDEVVCRRVAYSVNGPVDFIGTQSCDLVASRRV